MPRNRPDRRWDGAGEYDVPLMPTRGYSSETFCFEAIASQQDDPRTYDVWYLGDFDRPGCNGASTLEEKLARFAEEMDVEVRFRQLAIAADDVVEFDERNMRALVNLNGVLRWLPAREPKRKVPADKAWPYPLAIELDAIEPDDLRRMVRQVIENYLPPEQLQISRVAEDSERELIAGLVDRIQQ